MSDVIHMCEVRTRDLRLRIIAARENCRSLLADFDVRVIEQRRGEPAKIIGGAVLRDFPRGLGVAELMSTILASNSHEGPAVDERGAAVPLPDKTPQEWMRLAGRYQALARECIHNAATAPASLLPPPRGPLEIKGV